MLTNWGALRLLVLTKALVVVPATAGPVNVQTPDVVPTKVSTPLTELATPRDAAVKVPAAAVPLPIAPGDAKVAQIGRAHV